MVSFRKTLMVVAVLALFVGIASAQTSTCTTTGAGVVLRAEGVTEAVGPQTVTCPVVGSGVVPTNDYSAARYNITLYAPSGVTITSQTDATTDHNDEVRFTGSTNSYGVVSAGGATINFNAVHPIAYVSGQSVVQFTLSGIRVNATTLPTSGPAFANGVTFTLLAQPIDAIGNPVALFANSPIYNMVNVAFALPTVKFSAGKASSDLKQCTTKVYPWSASKDDPDAAFTVQFEELYSASFLTKGQEAAITDDGNTDYVSNGTRLMVTFGNIASGITLYVPNTVNNGSLALEFVKSAAADGSGGTLVSTMGWSAVSGGIAVYEVVGSSTASVESATIGVAMVWTGTGAPPLTTTAAPPMVAGQYAPISANSGPTDIASGVPVPRFYQANVTSVSGLYKITPCQTTLLFPYLTNSPGWSNGIAISNTGATPSGDNGQPGVCNFSFYGAAGNVPTSPVVFGAAGFGDSTPIASGTTAADVVGNSGVTPGFQAGYAFAVCNFLNAEGYAFVVGTNQKGTWSNGYLAVGD